MPRIREVGSINPQDLTPPNDPKKEQVTITPADTGVFNLTEVKPQNSSPGGIDFAALAKSTSERGIIPKWLTQDYQLETVDRQVGDYLGFVEPQGKNYPALAQKGMKVGDIFAFIKGEYVKLDPLKFFLIDSVCYRTNMNASGAFTFATRDISTHTRDIVEQHKLPFDHKYLYNHYVCLLVIVLEGKLIPLRADFRGPKEHAGAFAARAVEAAKTMEWLKSSPAHIVTATMPIPHGRVMHTVTLVKDIGKTSGKELYRAHCSSIPATPEQMMLFLNHLNDTEFVSQLDDSRNYFESRLEYLDKICEKSANPTPPAK